MSSRTARFLPFITSSQKRRTTVLLSSVDILETPFCVLLPCSNGCVYTKLRVITRVDRKTTRAEDFFLTGCFDPGKTVHCWLLCVMMTRLSSPLSKQTHLMWGRTFLFIRFAVLFL